MVKTQGTTNNKSSKLGDEEIAKNSQYQDYELTTVYFFEKTHHEKIRKLFGYSEKDIEDISDFMIGQIYGEKNMKKKMKRHELYPQVLDEIKNNMYRKDLEKN